MPSGALKGLQRPVVGVELDQGLLVGAPGRSRLRDSSTRRSRGVPALSRLRGGGVVAGHAGKPGGLSPGDEEKPEFLGEVPELWGPLGFGQWQTSAVSLS